VGWIAVGTGVVGIGVGVALRVMAASDQNRAVAPCASGGACPPSALAAVNAANSKNVASNWAFLLGGAAAVTGLVLELTAPNAPNTTTVAVGLEGVRLARSW
jgi:hypothetical protein